MKFLFPLLLFLSSSLMAQKASIQGIISDENGELQPFATVALLHPEDSTVASFALSRENGTFLLEHLEKGNFLLQINQFSYDVWYKKVEVNEKAIDLGMIVLFQTKQNLKEVQVQAEAIPLRFNGDTIDYNASSFRTRENAPVEELLKKLPGVQVDESGNIKAQGENVNKITIEGKEVFGNDPKIISKNLPADAIKKVQVFDEKSAAEKLGGMGDQNKDKTINLVLKEDKKNLWFGNLEAAYGYENKYRIGSKLFNFDKKKQLAVLGNMNNINQFGFSIDEYINFRGGFGSMNGDVNLEFDPNDFPIDFGQPIYGEINSGVGGINYNRSLQKHRSLNWTYIGTLQQKDQDESSYSENYLGTDILYRNSLQNSFNNNHRHQLKMEFRREEKDRFEHRFSGSFNWKDKKTGNTLFSTDYYVPQTLQVPVNRFDQEISENNRNLGGQLTEEFSKKIPEGKLFKLFRFQSNLDWNRSYQNRNWQTNSELFLSGISRNEQQEQQYLNDQKQGSIQIAAVSKLGKQFALESSLEGRSRLHYLDRNQSDLQGAGTIIDSLSQIFDYQRSSLKPGIRLRRNGQKFRAEMELQWEYSIRRSDLKSRQLAQNLIWTQWLPAASLEYNFRDGHHINLSYQNTISDADPQQLFPIYNTINNLHYYLGNENLRPERSHQSSLDWTLFDQFSFLSIFSRLDAIYVKDKISTNQWINPDFSSTNVYTNVPYDYGLRSYFDFSSPIRKLKLNVHLELRNNWNQSLIYLNGIENISTNLRHRYQIRLDNRSKKKWDAEIGFQFGFTDSRFSISNTYNNRYIENKAFASIRYTGFKNWEIECSTKIYHYQSRLNGFEQFIPIVNARISQQFSKNKRWRWSLESFDLLDQNTGIRQNTGLQFLEQNQSSILRRYVLFALSYKINRAGK
ncbi:MAG: hypothetical protein EP338_07240 [Bacteroidetes bacterium]|nr:MAG: hypothetical protein EP338_07240 [Bacteroidota bacterium]